MSYNEQLQRNGPKCTLMPAGPDFKCQRTAHCDQGK